MQFKVLKTNEISEKVWNELTIEFNDIFDRNNSPENLRTYYCSNAFGFSYHCLAFSSDDSISGYTAIIPFYYTLMKERIIIGVGGGSFVKKEYRKDIFILKDIWNCLRDYCLKEGVIAFLGISNANSFKYSLEILNRTHLGDLKYFFLPVRPFNILKLKNLKWLNPIFMAFGYLYILTNLVFSFFLRFKEASSSVKIELYNEFYKDRFYKEYKEVTSCQIRYFYKVLIEDGIKTAYLMDFREKDNRSYPSLTKSLLNIIRSEEIDLVLYIGTLRMKQFAMFKLPGKKEPKHLPVVIDLLAVEDPSRYNILLDYNNWELSLMNFDMR
jgi:hypothetical protein